MVRVVVGGPEKAERAQRDDDGVSMSDLSKAECMRLVSKLRGRNTWLCFAEDSSGGSTYDNPRHYETRKGYHVERSERPTTGLTTNR